MPSSRVTGTITALKPAAGMEWSSRSGGVTLWVAESAVAVWRTPRIAIRGGQERHSPLVIETAQALRRAFGLPLRQTVSLLGSIIRCLQLNLPVPDHSTISRRIGHFAAEATTSFPENGGVHFVLDSNGLSIRGDEDAPRNGAADAYKQLIFVPDTQSGDLVAILVSQEVDGELRSTITDSALADSKQVGYSPQSHNITVSRRQSGGARLLRTRLRPPVRGGGLIDRRRLADVLELVRRKTLTLVRAPAGYGKSSLLGQWFEILSKLNLAVGWLALDRTEDDLIGFFRYVLGAIRETRPSFGERMGSMLDQGEVNSVETVCATFIDELLEIDEDVFLFVDDFHQVSDPKIERVIAAVLDHPPANLHLLVASRTALPFDLSHLKMRDSIVEVDAELLRFDCEEAESFLRLMGYLLTPPEVETVVAKTEGWAAGIQLASISLVQRKSEFFCRISGEHASIADFLAEDVVARLPAETINFLQRTSILERMNPELCSLLTGNSDARGQLEFLGRKGLFLFSLDHQRNWYRYHHLFASFLRHRLNQYEPEVIQRLHRIASDWFAEHGFAEEAVAHAIDAFDHRRAAAILEKCCSEMVYCGRYSGLMRWSKKIPHHILEDFPRLQLEIAWMLILEWRFADAERILNSVERKIGELGPELLEYYYKMIMHRKGMLYLFMDNMPKLQASVSSIIDTFPNDDPYLRGNLDTNLIYAQRETYELGGIDRRDACARDYYEKSGSVFVLVWHESIVGPTFFLRGEAERAERSLRSAMDIATTIEGPFSALGAMPALLLAEVLYERNELAEAPELIDSFGAEAERKGFLDHLTAFYVTRARLEFRAGNREAARKTLESGRISAERHGFERLRNWIEYEDFRQALIANDTPSIERTNTFLSKKAYVKPGSGITSGDEAITLTWAKACCVLGNPEKAAHGLRRWVLFLRERGAARSEVRLLIALAICLMLSGRKGEAARVMREAVAKAARPRFIRIFLDEGNAVETLLQMLFGSKDDTFDSVAAFGRELLRLFSLEPNAATSGNTRLPPVPETDASSPEILNNREREVLGLVAAGFSNKEIARRLGLTETTIKWYMQQIFAKLDVRRRINAVHRARQFGML